MGINPWVEERGVATFIVVARSGHGDDPAVAACEAIKAAAEGWHDPTYDVTFMRVSQPTRIEVEDIGDWYLMAVRAEYAAQERPTLPA
jgi:hypothetical protein